MALVVCDQAQQVDEIVHIYEYHSSLVEHVAVLTLRQAGLRTVTVRRCEFMTRGHMTDPHGVWFLDDDESKLTVGFNYRHRAMGDADLPIHRSVLQRIDTRLPNGSLSVWSGVDDKAAQIHLVHIRSMAKAGRRWCPEEEL